jgi:integrase
MSSHGRRQSAHIDGKLEPANGPHLRLRHFASRSSPEGPSAVRSDLLLCTGRLASAFPGFPTSSWVITTIAATAQLDDQVTAHTLRHTFATRLVRGRTDLITVAELLGHARLETTRGYSRPTHEERAEALRLLDVDQ